MDKIILCFAKKCPSGENIPHFARNLGAQGTETPDTRSTFPPRLAELSGMSASPPKSAKPRHWSLYFLAWMLGVSGLGVALGAVMFPLVGMVIGARFTVGELALNGAKILGFYFAIWAPGLALVLTVKRAYEQRKQRNS